MSYEIAPIGIVHSPFKEKFGVPRQPGLIPVKSRIEMLPPFNLEEAVARLDEFSHVWITFVFHQAIRAKWKPTVRPPRLGGNKKVGVFASRSPFRPNNLGLSVVRLEKIEFQDQKLHLHVTGLDVVDGTPVVDIKPYVPYVDKVDDAVAGFAENAPGQVFAVRFTPQAELQLQQCRDQSFRQLIADVLALDPRPAYRRSEKSGQFGFLLGDYNVSWEVRDNETWVLAVNPA